MSEYPKIHGSIIMNSASMDSQDTGDSIEMQEYG
jgi:hypothetical protein